MSTQRSAALTATFDQAYTTLNDAQREAVDTIEGPVMVIAGPGTGKTQILALRIANILRQTDTAPEHILALTFTDSGAKAMRDRLRHYIGAEAYRVAIFTFHGLANHLIARYPDAYPTIAGGRAVTDLEQLELFETILASTEITRLRPAGNPTLYVPHVQRMIGTLKQEFVTPTALREIIAEQEATLAAEPRVHEKGAHKGKVRGAYAELEKSIAKNHELAFVYDRYQAALGQAHWYDFNDMLLETVAALQRDESMLRDVQETYQYVLADEHQDVNGTQNTLLELIVSYHTRPNIFAVGDEKQAIYRFQGASLENFLKFTDVYPDTKTITLTANYRSGQPVLDAAHSLVAVEEGPLMDLRVPLTAAAVDTATVEQRTFHHQAVEDDWLVSTVAAQVAAGVPAHEIAVIVRTNREVEHVAGLLRSQGQVVAASADGDILHHPITEQLETLLRVVANPADTIALARVVLAPYWQLSTADRTRILAAQRYDRPLTMILSDTAVHAELGLDDPESVDALWHTIATARTASATMPPHRIVQQILQQSGFLAYVMRHDPIEGTRVVRRLYDEIESLVRHQNARSVQSVVSGLTIRRQYHLPLTAPYINAATEAIQVMTAHKSKGLEFNAVFVPYCTDRTWGGQTKPEYFKLPLVRRSIADAVEPLDDERRLMFVAMTRARHALYLSSSEQSSEGKELTPSRLLAELNPAFVTVCDTSQEADTFSPTTALSAVAVPSSVDGTLIRTLFLERGFSATSFNNYVTSPWLYVGKNLLRIPEVQGLSLLYGTAIHNVLERATRTYTATGHLPGVNDLDGWLRTELARQPLSAAEYAAQHERALETLALYREHLDATLPARTIEELKLSVVLETGLPDCPEVVLTGKLDRLDVGEDGRVVRVVDYKTGKPKSRNAIEGTTKNDDGAYKQQLVFYALLLELAGEPERATRTMTLSFVEPTSRGEIKEETFTITDEEIDSVRSDLVAAAAALSSGDWQRTACDPAVVEYCALMQPKTAPA
ncbi:MAG TPA: ATP-dependent DNA helicase [Candidatus Paceibacterota bacterium]|nr:ATP-dependent DNA helicase [Candidatus Paceibacterota bacterium]